MMDTEQALIDKTAEADAISDLLETLRSEVKKVAEEMYGQRKDEHFDWIEPWAARLRKACDP